MNAKTSRNIVAAVDTFLGSSENASVALAKALGHKLTAADCKALAKHWTEKEVGKAAQRKRLSRIRQALKDAGVPADAIYTDARGGARPPKEPKADTVSDTEKPASNDSTVLKRFGELAAAFLTAEDKAIATRLVAAIDHKMKAATASKARK